MVRLLRILDKHIGAIIVFLLYILSVFGKKSKERPRRFLIVKLWALGDSVLILPMIRGIKETFKGATVDVVATARVYPVFSSCPLVGKVYSIQEAIGKIRQYDVIFD